MPGKYADLSKKQLMDLLEKRDRTKRLGLIWERDEIEADAAINANFVACEIIEDLCEDSAPWRNVVIEGDNFDALRWLRMTYAGRVKCIYIDPPYNKGNKDWIYNDRYMDPEDRFRYSTWLEFLYRRLSLARDLLAEDGVVFISINDENRAILELLAKEAMPGMWLGSLVWRTRDTTSAKGKNYSDVHEHILVFAKPNFIFTGSQKSNKKYKNPDNDPRGLWNTDPLTLAFDRYERPNLFYPIRNPEDGVWYPCDPDRVWAYATGERLKSGQKTRSKTIEEHMAEGLIVFPSQQRVVKWSTLDEVYAAIDSGDVPVTPRDKRPLISRDTDPEFWVGKRIGFGRPGLKKFWSNLRSHVSPLSSWIARASEDDLEGLFTLRTGSGGAGTREIQAIFGRKAFPNPKPVTLINQLVAQSTGPEDLILDFFAGSGTTAHAVAEVNAKDGGDRRFIMVSSTEVTADEPHKNLCRDVTAERIRSINTSEGAKCSDLTAPFAYLRTKEIAFEDLDYDLSPSDAWTALEALHDLPLTVYDSSRSWSAHEAEGVALVLVDRLDPSVLEWVQGRDRENLFVYTWAPGQIAQLLDGTQVDVRSVRETLARRFQQ